MYTLVMLLFCCPLLYAMEQCERQELCRSVSNMVLRKQQGHMPSVAIEQEKLAYLFDKAARQQSSLIPHLMAVGQDHQPLNAREQALLCATYQAIKERDRVVKSKVHFECEQANRKFEIFVYASMMWLLIFATACNDCAQSGEEAGC